ncbi:hypothetical protein [Streptomyces shaanxiensis]
MTDGDGRIDYDYTEMNRCFNERHTTNFAGAKNMDEMKAMLGNARPDLVKDVAAGWKGLATQLTAIQAEFDREVARIQEHWTGAAADGFAAKAKRVSTSIGNTAKYASHTSIAMTNAGSALGPIKDEVLAMEKPGRFSSLLNSAGDGFTRSREATDKDIAAGLDASEALDRNHDDLSAGREAQLKMAARMETLGAAYNSQAKAMGSWNKIPAREDVQDYPGDPGGITPTPVAVPIAGSSRSPQSTSSSTARSVGASRLGSPKSVTPPSGITGGGHKATAPTSNVGTAIDGISGAPTVGGGTPAGSGSAGGGVGIGSGAGLGGSALGAGAAREAMTGRPKGVGMAGRAGASGMVGRTGAAESGAGRPGSAVPQSGGISGGTPRSGTGTGRGTAGGSGLHSSRGAAGREANGVQKGGVVGAPGARTGRPRDGGTRERERPDYLIEDEETWVPQRNVAPRVIEG